MLHTSLFKLTKDISTVDTDSIKKILNTPADV